MATKDKSHLERKKAIVKADKRRSRKTKPTSYDTSQKETSSAQNVRESVESPAEHARTKKS